MSVASTSPLRSVMAGRGRRSSASPREGAAGLAERADQVPTPVDEDGPRRELGGPLEERVPLAERRERRDDVLLPVLPPERVEQEAGGGKGLPEEEEVVELPLPVAVAGREAPPELLLERRVELREAGGVDEDEAPHAVRLGEGEGARVADGFVWMVLVSRQN